MKNLITLLKLNTLLIMFISFSTNTLANEPVTGFPDKDPISFIVHYTGDVNTALNSNDQYMRTFIEVYNLEVIKTFDEENGIKGFVLAAPLGEYEPLDLAKELSLIENVMMVELEEISKIKIES